MADHTDPIIRKNIGSTLYYYNVEPNFFDNKLYWSVIKEKINLAKLQARNVQVMQKGCVDSDQYLEFEQWLNDIYKAQEFNEQLLKERKKMGK